MSSLPACLLPRRSVHASALALLGASVVGLSACGGGAPPVAPTAPPQTSKPVAIERRAPPPPDVSAVPEPAGLVLVGRVSKAEGILKTLGTWTRLPIPGAADLVRSISDDSVASAVDLSQPVDAAVALGGNKRMPRPLIALSVPVRSFEDAKEKLSARHPLTKGSNGQLFVEGLGRPESSDDRARVHNEDEDEDDAPTCVLSPASTGARLVCGERDALEALSPYLTRTVSRRSWPSDVHVEVSLGAVSGPLDMLRASLPGMARSMFGKTSPAVGRMIESSVGELADFIGDTGRMTLDAQLEPTGLQATFKVDYVRSRSLLARLATDSPQRAEAPPPTFWHLPAETDLAVFGRGSDPKLFDHPRELLGDMLDEATEGVGMADAERKAVRSLLVDRMLGLFTGPVVYGKGYDAAALDKAIAARTNVKSGDRAAADEADHRVAEQALGWHLVHVSEPITKVGPIFAAWIQLWNRPAFAKWSKGQTSAKALPQMRIVPAPAGVVLPKDAVHLEIVIPRTDMSEMPAMAPPSRGGRGQAPPVASMPKGKKVPRRPAVIHFFAVPDQGSTWIGLGLDGKLVAQRAAASLSSAPEAGTLGKSAVADSLRDVKANGAWLATLRGFAVFSAIDGRSRSPYAVLPSLPGKGATPITMTFAAEPPSPSASVGSAVTTLKLPREAIEDAARLLMSK